MSMKHERGATLIVGLVLLLLLTMVGMSGLNVSTMQEKMSGSMRDRQLAFQSAEAALRLGEEFVAASTSISTSVFGVIETQTQAGSPDFWDKFDWVALAKQPVDSNEVDGVASQPYFVVENLADTIVDDNPSPGTQMEYGQVATRRLYRVTALGIGASESAEAILQSTIEKD